MTEYVCPASINALFDEEATKPEGRRLAVEWAKHLPLKIGDRIWLPEIGWTEKAEGRAN